MNFDLTTPDGMPNGLSRTVGFNILGFRKFTHLGLPVEEFLLEQKDGRRKLLWVRAPLAATKIGELQNIMFHAFIQDTSKYKTLSYNDAVCAARIKIQELFERTYREMGVFKEG